MAAPGELDVNAILPILKEPESWKMAIDASLYLAAGGLFVAYVLLTAFVLPLLSTQQKYLRSQSWTGMQKQWFATYRAGIKSVMNTRQMALEGYEKFSRNNKLFVLPQFSRDPFVVLPADKVHEFLSKGDDRVDHQTIGRESIAMKWCIGDEFEDSSHFDVVRRQLTRKLPTLTADVYAELVLAMKDQWPVKDGEWTTVNTYPTCMKIVSRAANRVFSGKDLCRNPEYLESSRLYAQEVFKSGALLKLIPDFLHPIVAPIIVRGVKKHLAICRRISTPIIETRLKQMRELGKEYVPANDVLQWVLDDSLAAPAHEAHKRNPDWICRCLLLLNMVAIHTTSMVTSNTIMDLYTSPHRDDVIAGLREECERALQASGGEWSKEAVNSLLRVDSTIRESMRWSSLGDLGMPRIVKDPKGVDLTGGIHIPKGVRVVVPAFAIHTDETFYPNAKQWDAFRFSRPMEEFRLQRTEKQSTNKTQDLEKVLDLKNRGLIVTTDDFFSFGFGKHACPGRFFASQEMKLMMAYIVMTYDIDMKGPRPANMLINGSSVPRDAVEMKIRLRQS